MARIVNNTKNVRRWQWDVQMIPYAVVVIALILAGVQLCLYKTAFRRVMSPQNYQAVFLSNGQVYFGHLRPLHRSFYLLTDVYYLQEQAASQDGTATDETSTVESTATEAQSQLSVIRLGEEVHQPTNGLVLNRDHILFWENLTADSRIVDAITEEQTQ